METICSPFSATPSILGKCFSDFFLTFLPESIWTLLIALEFTLRKKKSSLHPPLHLVVLQLLHLLLDFIGLTLLLFLIDTDLVSGAAVLSYISQLFLWMTILYSYQISFQPSVWGLSHMYTLKAFTFIRIPWIIFKLVLDWMESEENIEDIYILKVTQTVSWVTSMVFISLLIIEFCRNSRNMYQDLRPSRDENSYERSSIFSKVFVFFIYGILNVGYSKHLEESDIEKPRKVETTEYQKKRIKSLTDKYLARKDDKHGLLKAVYARFWSEILSLVFIGIFASGMELMSPIFILALEKFLDSDQPYWRGFALVSYMLLCKFGQALGNNHFRFHSALLGGHIRAGISSIIYEKSLKISSSVVSSSEIEGSAYTYGQVVNLMQVDLERVSMSIQFSMRALIWPFQMALGLYLLFLTVRWQGTIGSVGLIIVMFAINGLVARYLGKLQKIAMEKKDVRMKFCTELLNNMKVFKLYNWEKKICERVKAAREEEMTWIVKSLKVLVLIIFINWGTRNYLVFCIIATLTLLGYPLTPGEIFAGSTVIGILNMTIRLIPDIVSNFINMIVSLKRIQDYLQCQEVVSYVDTDQASARPDIAVAANLASFSWEPKPEIKEGELVETKLVLKDLNYSIKKGEFVAVVGRVGAGKSSFIHAMIQNMNFVKTAEESSIFMNGIMSYVSQEAWIQNGTIKDNILFGNEWNESRYQTVIKVSQLENDLAILPGGDLTEIGERGINLSGGQKTRVALARAVYAKTDIVLLDDPLSAVDAHVGNEIFHSCFQEFLRGKTRILVTNNQQFLPAVDRVIVLNSGRIVEVGPYNELINNNGYFANEFLVDLEHPELQKAQASSEEKEVAVENKETAGSKIIESEERAVGRVDLWVFKVFYQYMGGTIVIVLTVFFMLLWQADRMFTDIYLGEWTEKSLDHQQKFVVEFLVIYGISSFMINVFILFRLLVVFSGVVRAAKTIFARMLEALMNAPVNKYFDITPSGRILNRLSKDQFIIDGPMNFIANLVIGQVFGVFCIICVCCYVVPYILIIVPIALYLSMKVQYFYLSSSRELMRLESMSRSPIVHHFSESISGVNTIRAFGYQKDFIDKNSALINKNMSIYFTQQASSCWLGINLEVVADLILAGSMFFIIGTRDWIEAGLVGVLLSYAITLPENIYWMIFANSNLENMMVSVERNHQLSTIQSEAPRERQKDKDLMKINWPSEGRIEFRNYQMKYRDDTEIVLKGVNGVINPQEKIGIVGRTGSGKSSLCLGLFRLVEAYDGQILIDDVDISEIGLDILRRKLCVIPQEPTLFQGTVKENIDPFGECSEEQLREAIKLIELFPDENPCDVLAKEVAENGSNFSLGQRQLICITRAIVRNSKIMFLDEATASVDYKTDELIQNIIRDKFADKTVLTIAHRMNTILDYDRVIVMDKGVIAEFDTPDKLLEKKGIFYSLVKKHKKVS